MLKKKDFTGYIGILVGLIIGVLGILFISLQLTMNDAFWHIKVGEWVSKEGFIYQCKGSWNLAEESWKAHEWLFGWIIYQVARLGLDSVIRMCMILFLLTLSVCLYQAEVWRYDVNPPMLYWEGVLMLQFSVFALTMTARPQYISVLFVAIFLLILKKSMNGHEKWLYFLPLITILWVNIHGGTSMLAYVTIFVFLACNIVNWDIGRIHFEKAEKRWTVHCAISLVLTVLAIMINPYGFEMLLYPYTNMQDKVMISIITEWAAPDAKNITVLFLQILPMLFGIVALIQYQGRVKAHDVALFFLYTILYLRSARFYAYLTVVQTCLIMPYAFRLSSPFAIRKKEKPKKDMRLINNFSLLLAGGFCIIYIAVSLVIADYESIKKNKILPDELLEMVCLDKPERICNYYDAGGYLLYHDINVFVDGRYEPFKQKSVFEEYRMLTRPKNLEEYKNLEQLIHKYEFDAFLLTTSNIELVAYLEEREAEYELRYADENWVYYVERN